MIGLVLLLLLRTPTIWFSLDHKWNVSDGVVSKISRLAFLRLVFTSDGVGVGVVIRSVVELSENSVPIPFTRLLRYAPLMI